MKITGGRQKCPKQWKTFLSSVESQRTLTKFLLEQWSQDTYVDQIGSRKVYYVIKNKCFSLPVFAGKVICVEVPESNSDHEEVDRKLLLHAKHAADNGESTIIFMSPGTDVAFFACHFRSAIPARLHITKKKERGIFTWTLLSSGASAISEGDIFIYSCSTQLISFEIDSISKEINCAEHEYMNMSPSLIALAPLLTLLQ